MCSVKTYAHTYGCSDVQDVRQLGAQHVTLHIKSMVGDLLPSSGYGVDLHAAHRPVSRRSLSVSKHCASWWHPFRPSAIRRTPSGSSWFRSCQSDSLCRRALACALVEPTAAIHRIQLFAVAASQAGFSMRLLDNTHHKDELWRLGVRPATAFACGVDFLLRIRPQALAPHQAALQVSYPAKVCCPHSAHGRARCCAVRSHHLCAYLRSDHVITIICRVLRCAWLPGAQRQQRAEDRHPDPRRRPHPRQGAA